jgi:hypothetical protein
MRDSVAGRSGWSAGVEQSLASVILDLGPMSAPAYDTRYVAARLDEAFGRPLTHPGSEGLARLVLSRFDFDFMPHLAEKAVETLQDGLRHDRTMFTPGDLQVGLTFVTWSGTYREVQSERYGEYLNPMLATALAFARAGLELAGFLQIDAFLRADETDRTVDVDVAFSFVPGELLDFPPDRANPLPNAMIVDTGVCTPDELQPFRHLMA